MVPVPDLRPQKWRALLAEGERDADWPALFAPLTRDGVGWVLARAAQSLDGFIAAPGGASQWIGGDDDILHTHRLRALCDAVVVGAGTVRADDPQLTTRACEGPSPVRVVIDRQGRLRDTHRVFASGPRTLLLTAAGAGRHGEAEIVRLPTTTDGSFAPRVIVAALAERGLRRLLVEGGGHTVTRFLLGGALDRMHVTVAPLLLGGGIPAFPVPPCEHPSQGMRLAWTAHALGRDVLLDIPLRRAA